MIEESVLSIDNTLFDAPTITARAFTNLIASLFLLALLFCVPGGRRKKGLFAV
jgi:hypothetical protein